MAKQKKNKNNFLDPNHVYYYVEDVKQTENYHFNENSCLDPLQFVDEGTCCNCTFEVGCIYYKKYQNYKP